MDRVLRLVSFCAREINLFIVDSIGSSAELNTLRESLAGVVTPKPTANPWEVFLSLLT